MFKSVESAEKALSAKEEELTLDSRFAEFRNILVFTPIICGGGGGLKLFYCPLNPLNAVAA